MHEKTTFKKDYGLPKTFAEAKGAGWTFKVVGETKGKKPYEKVGVTCTSPDGKKSTLFSSIPFGETLTDRERKMLDRLRKVGRSPIAEAMCKAVHAVQGSAKRNV